MCVCVCVCVCVDMIHVLCMCFYRCLWRGVSFNVVVGKIALMYPSMPTYAVYIYEAKEGGYHFYFVCMCTRVLFFNLHLWTSIFIFDIHTYIFDIDWVSWYPFISFAPNTLQNVLYSYRWLRTMFGDQKVRVVFYTFFLCKNSNELKSSN